MENKAKYLWNVDWPGVRVELSKIIISSIYYSIGQHLKLFFAMRSYQPSSHRIANNSLQERIPLCRLCFVLRNFSAKLRLNSSVFFILRVLAFCRGKIKCINAEQRSRGISQVQILIRIISKELFLWSTNISTCKTILVLIGSNHLRARLW